MKVHVPDAFSGTCPTSFVIFSSSLLGLPVQSSVMVSPPWASTVSAIHSRNRAACAGVSFNETLPGAHDWIRILALILACISPSRKNLLNSGMREFGTLSRQSGRRALCHRQRSTRFWCRRGWSYPRRTPDIEPTPSGSNRCLIWSDLLRCRSHRSCAENRGPRLPRRALRIVPLSHHMCRRRCPARSLPGQVGRPRSGG